MLINRNRLIHGEVFLLPNIPLEYTLSIRDNTLPLGSSNGANAQIATFDGTISAIGAVSLLPVISYDYQSKNLPIEEFSLFNADNQTQDVLITIVTSSNTTSIIKAKLEPNWTLKYCKCEWEVFDEKGVKKNDDDIVSIKVTDTDKQTYSFSITGLLPAGTPTDIFTITGSATKTVKIKKLVISGTKTTNAILDVLVLKRSTANTLGTSTTPVGVPLDSNNAAATAVVRAYTTNPVLGTLIGALSSFRYWLSGGTSINPDRIIIDYDSSESQAPTLRGINEVLAVNLNGTATTMAGGLWNIYCKITEE